MRVARSRSLEQTASPGRESARPPRALRFWSGPSPFTFERFCSGPRFQLRNHTIPRNYPLLFELEGRAGWSAADGAKTSLVDASGRSDP